jgi:sec-independent protein translocase protein TatA
MALFMGPLGMQELLIILLIALIIFGGKKIPELAKGLGQGIREFKTSLKDGEQEGQGANQPGTAKDS